MGLPPPVVQGLARLVRTLLERPEEGTQETKIGTFKLPRYCMHFPPAGEPRHPRPLLPSSMSAQPIFLAGPSTTHGTNSHVKFKRTGPTLLLCKRSKLTQ